LGDLRRESDGHAGLGIGRGSPTVQRDLRAADPGQVQAEIGVGREAIVATVDLSDGQRDPLPCPHVQRPGERAAVAEETLQGRRAERDQTIQVRDDAELLGHGVEQGLRGGGGGFARGNGDTGHRFLLGSIRRAPVMGEPYGAQILAIIRPFDNNLMLF
jgi:hypothetical protein